MTKCKKVLVVGASGLVGNAVMKHMARQRNISVVAVSRRMPSNTFGADFVSVDLTNQKECSEVFGKMAGITHIVYAALFEKQNLTSGWLEQDQIRINDQMLRNIFEPVERASKGTLTHVTLLQGTKAYGGHVRPFAVPAREGKSDARDIPNFYWAQEDYIRSKQQGKDWNWTIFRPQIIVGESIGSAMNIIPAIGVYASLLKEEGKPLYYPGQETAVMETVDADLLARAIDWAGDAGAASNEIFNITNGDIMVMKNIWPAIAEAFEMELGGSIPISLASEMPKRTDEWDQIRAKYNLASPNLREFVGQSFQFADRYLNDLHHPLLVSTVKLREAGFYEVFDTESMFKKWFRIFQEKRLLPSPSQMNKRTNLQVNSI
ncbi:SDR family oxidoreductase [Neobacillus cucumis]|uniref:SDR family oxidoreductase n=1 Tax=Neobacillus cucumis TaxID=1740721 RepID=UPI0018E0549D|nr:SDR family oxidoreductase [Neobacillus cucumis]MBI0579230.1 SDR family oxidoreductase [Neobacillus cucumis]